MSRPFCFTPARLNPEAGLARCVLPWDDEAGSTCAPPIPTLLSPDQRNQTVPKVYEEKNVGRAIENAQKTK
jgi:hypothetical protein